MFSLCCFLCDFAYYAVVVYLPIPVEGKGRLQFSDLFTEHPVTPQAAGLDGTFKCVFILFLAQRSHFLDLNDAILFLQGLLYLCVHFY